MLHKKTNEYPEARPYLEKALEAMEQGENKNQDTAFIEFDKFELISIVNAIRQYKDEETDMFQPTKTIRRKILKAYKRLFLNPLKNKHHGINSNEPRHKSIGTIHFGFSSYNV